RMVEHHARGDVLLALLRELGPQLGDRRIEIEPAAARQHVGAERSGALGAGEHDAERVPGPRRVAPGVGHAAPQIDHLFAAHRQADRGAELAFLGKVLGESLGDALEALLALAVDFHSPGTGSLKASRMKRVAWARLDSSMPWPTPGAMCLNTSTP